MKTLYVLGAVLMLTVAVLSLMERNMLIAALAGLACVAQVSGWWMARRSTQRS